MYLIESGQPGSQIQTPYDAFWWTLVTLSTVGYGDLVPKTEQGRFVASLLILFGVGLFGAISGFMASLFLQPGRGMASWRSGVISRVRSRICCCRSCVPCGTR